VIDVLSILPDFDRATEVGSKWLEKFHEICYKDSNEQRLTFLKGDRAYEPNIWEIIKTSNPKVITLIGHGNHDVVTCQDHDVLFMRDERTKKMVKEKIIILLSCSTGKAGGIAEWLVKEAGAQAVICYSENYIFLAGHDVYESPFFESHCMGDFVIAHEGTVEEAVQKMYDTYTELINDPKVPEDCKPWLMWDRDCLKYYGDGFAKITDKAPDPPENELPWWWYATLGIGISLIALGVISFIRLIFYGLFFLFFKGIT
jgi:hypothetical protein